MDLEDKKRLERDESRNNLEAMIYKCKELTWEDSVAPFATEEEMEKLKQLSADASEWLEDNAEAATIEAFDAQFALLKPLYTKINFRMRENESRPIKIDHFKDILNQSIKLAETINNTITSAKTSTPDLNITADDAKNQTELSTDGLYTQLELDKLVEVIEKETKWLSDMIFKQESLEKNVDPVLLSNDLETRVKPMEFMINSLNFVERVKRNAAMSSSRAAREAAKTAREAAKKAKTVSATEQPPTSSKTSKSNEPVETAENEAQGDAESGIEGKSAKETQASESADKSPVVTADSPERDEL